MATIEREFVSLEPSGAARAGAGGRPCQGVYHRPAGQHPTTALVATHYEVDFSEHYLADHLPTRGFGFLGWNTRYRGNGTYFQLPEALIDIGAGVRWLREEAGVDHVVLLGNSGGASLMGAYQSQALEPNIRPTPGRPLPDAVGELEPADLFISHNAHPGRPDVLTMWLDPSVVDETDPYATDPALDMFDEVNGPPYDDEFVDRYRSAQVARNDRITDWCWAELDRAAQHGGLDTVFVMNRAWADLRFLDLSLDPSDRDVGCYLGDPRFANASPFNLAKTQTCRTWLSMWSLAESDCRAEPHLARITQPALVIQSTHDQGCFPSDAHAIRDALGADDLTFELIPGDHYLRSPDGARDHLADLVADWLGSRT